MRCLLRMQPLLRQRVLSTAYSKGRIVAAQTALRHLSVSASNKDTAEFSLRKLGKQETEELESKIVSYSQGHRGDTLSKQPREENLVPGANEASTVCLTDSAIDRLKYLSEQRGKTQYLRLRVDSGGCYGFSYKLDMTEEPEKDDVVIDRNGAKMVIDELSLPLVRGATIDWQDRLIGQAFLVVANPQSSGGCGCGSSFEIKMD
ncbi:General transcription factor 3C polypeptide 1 [Coemansia sp. RSA 988]|nr:General transcription factor 3C polypeptide 1 [Coemansia sp. RSA 988]